MTRSLAWPSYAGSTDTWLDPRAIEAIREGLPVLADEIVSVIQREVPEYSDSLRGVFGSNIRLGTEQALRRFIGERDAGSPEVYRALGYGEHQSGRSLDALQSAYRVGARIAWRRMSHAAAAAGATLEMQHHLAEAMFAYIDQLAAESVEGYAAAQLARAGDLERRRARLAALLLALPQADAATIADAARDARWILPRTLACLVVGGGEPGPVARRVSGDALHAVLVGQACVIVPDPGALAQEASAAAERLSLSVGVGPTLSPAEAPTSLRWAGLACELARPGTAFIAEENLADIALRAAPEVVGALQARALAPLERESPRSRERLAGTLASWLRHRGSQAAIAAELGVHAQTVRYRMNRLRELFGTALEDPDGRFELEIALRDWARHGEAGARHG
jgi:PucR C-terminal helix-turn-helix domain